MEVNNRKSRKEFWHVMVARYPAAEVEAALNTLPADSSRILQLHYLMKYSLKDIAPVVNRSISYVRNKHNEGIFMLRKHFGNDAS